MELDERLWNPLKLPTEHGIVWIAPTQGIYEKLADPGGIKALTVSPGDSNTKTTSK
jgi:hypothetical protein